MTIRHAHLRRWTTGAAAFSLALVLVSAVAFLTIRDGSWNDLFTWLYIGSELSLPAYWNAALLALVGVAAALHAVTADDARLTRGWTVVAVVGLLLSVDEATRVHERTAWLVSSNPLPTFAWVVVGAPLALVLVGVLWWAVRPVPAPLKRGLAFALGLYILGALGFEALSGFWLREDASTLSMLFESVEELLEMTACVLAIHLLMRPLLPLRIASLGSARQDGLPVGSASRRRED